MDRTFSHPVFNTHPFPNCETQPPRCQLCAIVRLFITNRNIDLHNLVLLRDDEKLVVAVALESELNPTAFLFKETQRPYKTGKHFASMRPQIYFKNTMTKLEREGRIIRAEGKYRYSQEGRLSITILALPRFCSKPPTVNFNTDIFQAILQSHNLQKQNPSFQRYHNQIRERGKDY